MRTEVLELLGTVSYLGFSEFQLFLTCHNDVDGFHVLLFFLIMSFEYLL